MVANNRYTAAAVGVLFILATGCYIAGQFLHEPLLSTTDALELVFPNRNRVVAGVLTELVSVLVIPLIALVFYPILRRYAETLALSYIGLRLMEAVALLIVNANLWSIVFLSEAHYTGAADAAELAIQLSTLRAVNESAFLISVAIVFPIGSCLLNSILWKTRLVPRVISSWGVFGAILLLVGSLLHFVELLPSIPPVLLEAVLSGPIAIQEMVLATWLIAKGVDETGPQVGSA